MLSLLLWPKVFNTYSGFIFYFLFHFQGLSSDSSDPSPRRANSTSSSSTSSSNRGNNEFVRTETHFRTYHSDKSSDNHSDKSDKSSYSEKHDKETSKETLTHSDVYDFDENDATYVERNVLQVKTCLDIPFQRLDVFVFNYKLRK